MCQHSSQMNATPETSTNLILRTARNALHDAAALEILFRFELFSEIGYRLGNNSLIWRTIHRLGVLAMAQPMTTTVTNMT